MGFYTKTIYKKDSKNKLRLLTVMSRDGILTQISGLLDGKHVVHESESKAKNVGKSNETTPEQQAEIEARALIVKKLKEGYFDTQQEALDNEVILPMLAKEFGKEKHKIDWTKPVWVQPKLDGMRCITLKNGTKLSRKNTPIENMEHIKVFNTSTNIDSNISTSHIVDGELYVHGESFQTNMKYIKKYRKGLSEKIQYCIYDIISDDNITQRLTLAMNIALHSENCKWVPSSVVTSEKEIEEYHKKFLKEGYEGTIVRWGNEGYHINKRSSNLLKYKDFIDKAYKVVDVEPSDKNPEQGVIICQNDKGDKFGCGMKFSHQEREEILTSKDKYIGQTAEVRFFEYTDDGLPRFPVCVGFRLDK